MRADETTPVQERGGVFFKRDDLYEPFGPGDVNGGKARQCGMLLKEAAPSSVVTACSIGSPQAPIVAAFAEEAGIPCKVLYGGTDAASLRKAHMPRLAMLHGGKVVVAARTGRHKVLYAKAREIARSEGSFVVDYGINVEDWPQVMLGAVSRQCRNLPDEARALHIVCGSGITASGVLRGVKECGKRLEKAYLYCTAPDRRGRIARNVGEPPCGLEFVDMFHEKGFSYDRREPYAAFGIEFHPNYEAKMMRRAVGAGLLRRGDVVWVVGSEPRRGRP